MIVIDAFVLQPGISTQNQSSLAYGHRKGGSTEVLLPAMRQTFAELCSRRSTSWATRVHTLDNFSVLTSALIETLVPTR